MLQRTPEERQALITGGAGFIGSHLVDYLLSEGGWRVIVVDNFDPFYSPSVKRANIATHASNPHFKLYKTDIRRKDELRKVFLEHDIDVIVHLASRAGVRPSLECPEDYIDTNVTGTLHLLDCARDFNVQQFVFGSSSSVYGSNTKVPPPNTTAPHSLSPPTPPLKPLASFCAIHTPTSTASAASVSVSSPSMARANDQTSRFINSRG